jgi:hypothetical protein
VAKESASILALGNLFACTNSLPVKVRFTLKPMQVSDEKFLPISWKQKILLFPSRILDLFSCDMWNCAIPYLSGNKKKIKEKYSNIQKL